MNQPEKREEGVKRKIFEAAEVRFVQYGFNKTTMAEIAKDCEMSAANIYRFFENKEAIGVEMSLACFGEQETLMREILRRSHLTAAQKLETAILGLLQYNYHCFSERPRLSELVEFIAQKRWDVVERHKIGVQQSLIAEILAEGNRTGEFDLGDVVTAAADVQAATMSFHAPPLVLQTRVPLEEMEISARQVVRLLIRGLQRR
jgi:AcrR family transcriptional regulator